MCNKKVVLAKASLTENEFRGFVPDLQGSVCGRFTKVLHAAIEEGWIEVEVCSNGQIDDFVAKSILKESLTHIAGGLKKWGQFVEIVD